MKKLFIVFIFFIITFPALAGTLNGKVIGVHDGDTITVLSADLTQIKVRLSEIDAPELDQAYGTRAKQELSNVVFGKIVKVQDTKKDKYGRTLGRVFVENLDVNLKIVESGAAWAYIQYSNDATILDAEQKARVHRVGLWALQSDQITPPWEWRKSKKINVKKPEAVKQSSESLSCGNKKYCKQMISCAEAKFYLRNCGLTRIDGDGDGVPCEAICR